MNLSDITPQMLREAITYRSRDHLISSVDEIEAFAARLGPAFSGIGTSFIDGVRAGLRIASAERERERALAGIAELERMVGL